jgi:hypothetical protein
MSDTQWIGNDDGKNPYTVSVDIINQLNQQFINHGVTFVIQVGDLTDKGNKAPYTVTKVVGGATSTYAGTATQALDTRAIFAQPLYDHGIGFFPLRGNHEDLQGTAVEFVRIFPQTSGEQQNASPDDVFNIPNPDAATQPFPTKTGSGFPLGSNFSSPSVGGLAGLSYSFDYHNSRFVLLDQFTRTNGTKSLSVIRHCASFGLMVGFRHERIPIVDGIRRAMGQGRALDPPAETAEGAAVPTETRGRTETAGVPAGFRRHRVRATNRVSVEGAPHGAIRECQFHP